MKRIIIGIHLGVLYTSLSFALNLEQIYGERDPRYIQIYNQKFYDWIKLSHPDLKKCIGNEDQKLIENVIGKAKSWGDRLAEGAIDYTLEISYSQKESRLYKNLRLNDGVTFHYWNVDEKGRCLHWTKVKSKSYRLIPKSEIKGPFHGVARFQLGDQIYLEAFSLTYLGSHVRYWSQQHLKEFNQLSLRISWESERDYEIYFP